jgi:glutathionylspermidine amidase/synthetase
MRVSIYKHEDMTNDSQESMYWNGIYTGIKYQCVELARRVYLINYGLLFEEVRGAKEIANVQTIYHMEHKRYVYWPTYMNAGVPVVGSLLIWDVTEEFPKTGHIAVVTRVTQKYVEVVEQNYGTGRRRIPIVNGNLKSKGLFAFKFPY